jgi:transposase InsO family protein
LLRPILFGEVAGKDLARTLRDIADQEVTFPDGTRRKPPLSTLKRKWKLYQKAGFDALARRPRNDRGRSRKHKPEIIQRAVDLKKDQPLRSDDAINQFLKDQFKKTIPKSTLYRYLKAKGATRLKLGISKTKVRCRWTREETNALWLGDFEHGPYVTDHTAEANQARPVPTRLSAFIDCHSRYIVSARYYYFENFDVLIDTLLRAWQIHGASRELYVDNGKVYHATALQSACYRLNIKLLHRPPREPQPGGLIERFFHTLQTQFEAEVRAGDLLTLEKLNRSFSAWLETRYHERTHSETGQSPRRRYEQGEKFQRQVDIQKAIELFMTRLPRTVHRTHCDVQVEKRYFLVTDLGLRGDQVEVRFDPYAPLDRVLLYSKEGVYLGKALRYERERGAHPQTSLPTAPTKPKHDYLELLTRQHDEQLAQRAQGIDYRRAMEPRTWPFSEFVKTLAELLARTGGAAAFNADELEFLSQLTRGLEIDELLLRQACAQAVEKTLPGVAQQLQRLTDARRANRCDPRANDPASELPPTDRSEP